MPLAVNVALIFYPWAAMRSRFKRCGKFTWLWFVKSVEFPFFKNWLAECEPCDLFKEQFCSQPGAETSHLCIVHLWSDEGSWKWGQACIQATRGNNTNKAGLGLKEMNKTGVKEGFVSYFSGNQKLKSNKSYPQTQRADWRRWLNEVILRLTMLLHII